MRDFIFKVTVTPDDFREITYFNVFRKSRVLRLVLTIGVIFTLWVWAVKLMNNGSPSYLLVVSGVFVALAVLLLISTEYNARRAIAAQRDAFGRERIITLNSEGVHTEDAEETASYSWDQIVKVYELKGLFAFMLDAHQGILLPKAATGEEVFAVRANVAETVGAQRYERRCRE